jgi:hypothetical protein
MMGDPATTTRDAECLTGICLLPGAVEVVWPAKIPAAVDSAGAGISRWLTGFALAIREIRGLRRGMDDGKGRGIDGVMGGIERIAREVGVLMRGIESLGNGVERLISRRLLRKLNMVVVKETSLILLCVKSWAGVHNEYFIIGIDDPLYLVPRSTHLMKMLPIQFTYENPQKFINVARKNATTYPPSHSDFAPSMARGPGII